MDKVIKILIVDDERDIVSIMKNCLTSFLPNTKITKAYDGLEAYHYSMTLNYDLIISDHKMPFCNGVDFIQKIRTTNNVNKFTPVIFISGFVPEIENRLTNLDKLLYMEKPFQQERLIKFCKFLLGEKTILKLKEV